MSENRKPKIRIRMYRQGLGDCFLLTFFTENAGKEKRIHMLIDCGTLGAPTTGVKMADVLNHIATETDRHLDLLVITHEHKDHVSGFNTTGQAIFKDFTVDNVWVAWTEDPEDALAQSIKKYEKDLLSSLLLSAQTLSKNMAPHVAENRTLREVAAATRELLSFSGDFTEEGNILAADFAETVHAAMNYATNKLGKKTRFLRTPKRNQAGRLMEPGQVLNLEGLPEWRFYVLGPPYDRREINRLGDDTSKELYHLSERLAGDLATNTLFFESDVSLEQYRKGLEADARQRFDTGLPFDACFRIEKRGSKAYKQLVKAYETEAWRRIDYDWLASTEDLALQLDSSTNNASLVLAIQYMKDGRVLLFPGDAQLGNWASWEAIDFRVDGSGAKPLKSKDLLENTVFYKVGHHASHNATMKQNGLEAMNHPDLVAMIPVDSRAAANKGQEGKGWNMPAPALYRRLLEQTKGRVLRSDVGWPRAKDEEDEEQKPPLWLPDFWKEVSGEIQKYTREIQKNMAVEKVTDKDTTYHYSVYRESHGRFEIRELQGRSKIEELPETAEIEELQAICFDYFLY